MNIEQALLWGFVATLALTLTMALSQGLRLTRMSVPLLLGTMMTGNMDRAKMYGFVIHFINGWLFSLLYGLIFFSVGSPSWWLGAALGAFHGLFVLAVLIPLLPNVHPRMASAYKQPEPTSLLEPPGFLVLNYGFTTPIITMLAHILYGLLLGAFL